MSVTCTLETTDFNTAISLSTSAHQKIVAIEAMADIPSDVLAAVQDLHHNALSPLAAMADAGFSQPPGTFSGGTNKGTHP